MRAAPDVVQIASGGAVTEIIDFSGDGAGNNFQNAYGISKEDFKHSYGGSIYKMKKPDHLVSKPAGQIVSPMGGLVVIVSATTYSRRGTVRS